MADKRKTLQMYHDKSEVCNTQSKCFKFHEEIQWGSECFDQFVIKLKLLVKDCRYLNNDKMIRDRIVFGTNSLRAHEKLLYHSPNLTLENAIDIACSYKLSQHQQKNNVLTHC